MVSMLLLLSFLLWGFGQAQPLASAWRARASALLIAGIAITGFNLIGFEAAESSGPDRVEDSTESTAWAAYSESAVASALAAGRPAFVVFTADWCITCKVNEKRVIERPATLEALQGSDVALFKADWTRRDEAIRQKLAEFGRAGVPLYLVYSPEKPNQPEVLSELLGAHEIQAALGRVGAGKPAQPSG
jgi:thiol:disulfide interchange protein DsbD